MQAFVWLAWGFSLAPRLYSSFRILPDPNQRKSKSPPNQPMVGRGTLECIDYSECLPGPPAQPMAKPGAPHIHTWATSRYSSAPKLG
jgi:hypothetical protein